MRGIGRDWRTGGRENHGTSAPRWPPNLASLTGSTSSHGSSFLERPLWVQHLLYGPALRMLVAPLLPILFLSPQRGRGFLPFLTSWWPHLSLSAFDLLLYQCNPFCAFSSLCEMTHWSLFLIGPFLKCLCQLDFDLLWFQAILRPCSVHSGTAGRPGAAQTVRFPLVHIVRAL